MDLGLKGKGAIVTGGSLGIGAAIARLLGKEGCNVAVNYRRHDAEAKKVVEDIEAMGARGLAIQADVKILCFHSGANALRDLSRGVNFRMPQ